MARLKIGIPLPDALFSFFNITARQGYAPDLVESVQPVAIVANLLPTGASIANAAQYAGRSEPLAGAGVFSHGSFYNPGTSAKDVYIDQIFLGNTNAGAIQYALETWATALTGLFGTWNSTEGSYAPGVVEQRTQTAAGIIPNQPLFSASVAPGTTLVITPPKPFHLAPGQGIVAVPLAVNLNCNFYVLGRQVG